MDQLLWDQNVTCSPSREGSAIRTPVFQPPRGVTSSMGQDFSLVHLFLNPVSVSTRHLHILVVTLLIFLSYQ